MEKKTLYNWQARCLRKWKEHECRGMVQAVTGSGKTWLALSAAGILNQTCNGTLRIWIVVPSVSLQRQWERALREFLASHAPEEPVDIGRMGGGSSDLGSHKYMICIIHSARYRMARRILHDLQNGNPVLLIADECHHYASEQNRLIFDFIPLLPALPATCGRYYSLGLSATFPDGEDTAFLASVLGPLVYSYGIREAATDHALSDYQIFSVSLPFSPEEQDQYQLLSDQMATLYRKLSPACPALRSAGPKERFELLRALSQSKEGELSRAALLYLQLSYKRKNLTSLASDRVPAACAILERLPGNQRVLLFCERIRQAEELYIRLSQEYPQKVGCYHSQRGALANRNALERFRNGELRIFIACKSLDEGFDLPSLSVGIVLSGTASHRQRIQRLGRLLRKKEGKRASLYYLRVEGSNEEAFFLPDAQDYRFLDLWYDPKSGLFSSPDYDAAALRLLEDLVARKTLRPLVEEVERCLDLGRVRGDWAAGDGIIRQGLQHARNIREKNYWICMREVRKRAPDLT